MSPWIHGYACMNRGEGVIAGATVELFVGNPGVPVSDESARAFCDGFLDQPRRHPFEREKHSGLRPSVDATEYLFFVHPISSKPDSGERRAVG